jgi:hypothetical protein
MYIYKCYICWALWCMCWDGNSGSWRVWGKNWQEKVFWVLWWGDIETTDLGLGMGVNSSVYPHFYIFRSISVGVLLTFGGYDLSPVWKGEDQLVDRTLIHTTSSSVGLGPCWAQQVRIHTCQQDSGYQWWRGGSETTFSQCDSRVTTREHFTVPVQFPSQEMILRAKCRIGP